jgi:hypothetical protein
MLRLIKRLIGSSMAGGKEVATRQEMLRHTEFHQFARQSLGKNSSPHELHWAIRDALLDAGAKIDGEALPTPTSYWSMTVDSMVGHNVGCEADYVPFAGSLKASKGRALGSTFYMILIISTLLLTVGIGIIGVLGCGIYAWWITTYHRGKLMARYDGVYRRPAGGAETAAGVKNWEFQVDLMLSYHVEVPPFGEAMGPQVVGPVYQEVIARALTYAHTGMSRVRSQPQLITRHSHEFEDRFPVQESEPVSTTDVDAADRVDSSDGIAPLQ